MKTVTTSQRCRFPGVLLAGIIVMLVVVPAAAQTLTTGVVSGIVASPSGERVPNVLVTLRDPAAGSTVSVTAARTGTFRFEGLPPATYMLTVERIGFAPLRVVQIEVRPERELSLRLELDPVEGGVTVVDERIAAVAIEPVGSAEWVPKFALTGMPGRSNTLPETGRFSTRVDASFTVEGLPGWLSTAALDGTPFRAVSLLPARRGPGGVSFPVSGIAAAQMILNPLDVEWSGTAGSVLSAYTLRGAEDAHGGFDGQWAGDVLSASSLEGGSVSYSDVRGGAVLRGGAGGGGMPYTIGFDARREQTPVASAWTDADAAQRLIDSEGSLDIYRRAAVTTATALAGFARADWPMSERHDAEFVVHGTLLPSFDVIAPSGAITEQDGLDLVATATVLSQLGDASHNELRASLTSSERTEADDDDALPLTMFVQDALVLGISSQWISARDAHVRVSDALHFRTGRHTLKIGGAATFSEYRYDAQAQPSGEYVFGDVDQFLAGTGVLTRIEGAGSAADWSDRTLAIFAQDRFAIGGDLEITAGLRAERQTLPAEVELDMEWARLTGLANDEVDEPGVRLSPRASVTWNVGGAGRWIVSAAGGIYYDRLDPLILAGWQRDDGSLNVRRVVGDVSWPRADEADGRVAPRLTMLGSGFEAARTLRVTGGVSAPLPAGTTLTLSGVVRRTENLPRRTDLNLVSQGAAEDQHGRVTYGTLVKQGGLVAAEPGSNRLFGSYDEVAAIVTDRSSQHWGMSAGLERALNAGFGFVARYTFGRTTDDWFSAADGGSTMAAPQGLGNDSTWVDGTSDLDVPHRFAAGLIWTGPAAVRVGAAYRMQSGRPFTPGFRSGVDANGDGVTGNDPAFVDDNIPGMDALISSWSCLRTSAGRFAERNACRTSVVHGLDINLTVPLIRFTSGAASLRLDVFDVLESSRDVPDAALYLIDPAADLVVDPVARTVTLPLIANERFGEPLPDRHSGRIVRVGFSINW
jgi:hypothetical protein